MLKQTRLYTCDLCDVSVETNDKSPPNWRVDMQIYIQHKGYMARSLSADFCDKCNERLFPSEFNRRFTIPKDEFKLPWWKKFFNVCEE